MNQLTLLSQGECSKAIIHVPVADLVISSYNPRRQRNTADIDKLSERIRRNGFEITRALWVYRNGHGYEVFAGGNRLEAAKRAGLEDVPVLLHSGYTVEQVVGLADQDNENDEYHAPVSLVDTWLHYKSLAEQGWTQDRIAKAKGVKQPHVASRLGYASWPTVVHLAFIQNEVLRESHALELDALYNLYIPPWYDRGAWMAEVIAERLKKTTAPTAAQFKADVLALNAVVQMVQERKASFDGKWWERLLAELAERKVRTKPQANAIIGKMAGLMQAEKEAERIAAMRATETAEAARLEAEQMARIAEQRDALMRCLIHGDSTQHDIPDGTKLLLTDPPYGVDYQSNRRVVKAKAERLDNDTDAILPILADVFERAYGRMAADSVALVWCSWRNEPAFRDLLAGAGFVLRGSLIWNKANHGSGDLDGSYAPKHERILYAVKGNPKMNQRHDDVLTGNEFLPVEHPTKKPLDLLRLFIEAHTQPDEVVADPFMGIGSTVIAAYTTGRQFWGCELNKEYWTVAQTILYKELEADGTRL